MNAGPAVWISCLILATGQPLAATRAAAPHPLVRTLVLGHSEDARVVAFNAGRVHGIALGDPFWVLDAQGLAAAGSIFLVSPTGCAGRLLAANRPIEPGRAAAVLPLNTLAALRDALPDGVTLRGELTPKPAERPVAWLSLGSTAGLRTGDTVLVRRIGLPIARGTLDRVEPDMSRAALDPLVSNAVPEPRDAVELWPPPADARTSRLESTLLAVQPVDQGTLIRLVGTARDGLAADQLVDVFRGHRFVALAEIVDPAGPLAFAHVIPAASASAPAVGDRAVVRLGGTDRSLPLRAAVFRIEGDYCFIAAGERDGVARDDVFVVHPQDDAADASPSPIAELTVETVKDYHCGARIHPRRPNVPLALWDLAERQSAPAPRLAPVGRVRSVSEVARSAVIDLDPPVDLEPGTIVRWRATKDADPSPPPGAAIVIHATRKMAILYVPKGWGPIPSMPNATVEASPPTPQPASHPATRRAPNR